MANGMQPSHRIKITQNIDKLIRTTSYNDLMKECIDRKLIFDVMRSEIEVRTIHPFPVIKNQSNQIYNFPFHRNHIRLSMSVTKNY